jgi:hypothetical protein
VQVAYGLTVDGDIDYAGELGLMLGADWAKRAGRGVHSLHAGVRLDSYSAFTVAAVWLALFDLFLSGVPGR